MYVLCIEKWNKKEQEVYFHSISLLTKKRVEIKRTIYYGDYCENKLPNMFSTKKEKKDGWEIALKICV